MPSDTKTKFVPPKFLLNLAKKLDSNGWIYVIFAVGDGLGNASSLLKYAHEVADPTQNTLSDRVHGWLLTPFGIVITIFEVLLVAGLAIVGSYFDRVSKNNTNFFTRFLARAWPYVRDSIKALKNAYKSVRSILFVALIFGASATLLPGLVFPLGLLFGLLSLVNRAWNRTMVNDRKQMQDINNALVFWDTSFALAGLTPAEFHCLKMDTSIQGYLKRATGSDYKNILFNKTELDALKYAINESTQIEIKNLSAKLIIITPQEKRLALLKNKAGLRRIMRRLYAEEKGLDATAEENVSLEVIANFCPLPAKKIKHIQESTYSQFLCYLSAGYEGVINGIYLYAGLYLLCLLTPPLAILVNCFSLFYALAAMSRALYEEFDFQRRLNLTITHAKWQLHQASGATDANKHKTRYEALRKVTYGSAVGEGMRNGLALYSAIAGCLFAVSLFTPIHVIVLLTAIGLGFVALCGFVSYALYRAYQIRQEEREENAMPDVLECGRSAASAVRNLNKISSFLFTALAIQGLDNHYHDSPIAFIVMAILTPLQIIIFIGKALAKGFGRPSSDPSSHASEAVRLTPTESSFDLGSSPTKPPCEKEASHFPSPVGEPSSEQEAQPNHLSSP